MLSLIIPTKGRPKGLTRLLKSIDVPTPVMVCATSINDLPKNLEVLNEFLSINVTIENCTIVKAINQAARVANNNIMVVCDDMEFIPGSLRLAMLDAKKDCVTGFRTGNMPSAVPIPVIGIDYYKQMGQLANPDYQHFFWDQETIDTATQRGKYRFIDNYALLNHYHPTVTGVADKTFIEGRAEKWINDEAVYRGGVLHR